MHKLATVVAAAVLVTGISGYAFAASAQAPKQIRACAKKNGGALRLASKCRKNERRVTWSQTATAVPDTTAFRLLWRSREPRRRGSGRPRPAHGPADAAGDGRPRPGHRAGGAAGAQARRARRRDGTNGTSTGETLFASAGAGQLGTVAASAARRRTEPRSLPCGTAGDGRRDARTGDGEHGRLRVAGWTPRSSVQRLPPWRPAPRQGTTVDPPSRPIVFPVRPGPTLSLPYSRRRSVAVHDRPWVSVFHATS